MMRKLAEEPIAIVGMACRLPGADDLDEYWQLLQEGRSALGELPPDRFDPELHYHPEKGVRTKSYTRLGGVTSDRPFDLAACPIPQYLVDQSHKVHLELCQVAAAACRNAGMNPFGGMSDSDVGVYIGHTPPSALAGHVIYARQLEETAHWLREVAGFEELAQGQSETVIREIIHRVRSQFPPESRNLTMRANAYHAAAILTTGFGLTGPSMSFDAACASSLRAFGHAVRALQLGEIDAAIVGGASYCHADTLVLFSQAQSVSPSGSRPFDEDADGLVAAEGYVAVVLKTLKQAVADGDSIHAVIRGVGISSDGRGKSLWAPRHEGQVEAIRRAYPQGISPRDLQFIEMHATSTQVGDATEMRALTEIFRGQLPETARIPIGSAKANVGHTLETAGLVSLVKTVLCMQHRTIPPQINVRTLNKEIDWDSIPFFVPQSQLPWNAPENGAPRRAAVNAFGIGGLNVHVVLEEHIPQPATAVTTDMAAHKSGNGAVHLSPSQADAAHEPIAIVGMGTVLPGARTIGALWDMFRSGIDQKHDVPAGRWDPQYGFQAGSTELWRVPTTKGGYITDFEYDWKRHRVPPKQIASADPLQFMLLDAADQAFEDAGYHEQEFDKLRTGVIVGTIFGGEFADQLQMGLRLPDFGRTLTEVLRSRGIPDEHISRIYEQYVDVLLKHLPALVDETGSFTASTLASRITKTFDLMGGATAVDSGDTSAFSALAACIDLLRAGDCDMMVCAAGQRSMGLACYEAMARTNLLAQGEPQEPFSASADGCVPGEGVGVLLLKRLSDAQRDGNKIHGIIRGVGAASSANLKDGLKRAIGRSLSSAGVGSEKVSVVEAASSGIRELDQQEVEAVAETYGAGQRSASVLVGAAAGQIGNIGGGAGMAALMKAVSELNHAEMPKNVGPAEPAPEVQRAEMIRLSAEPSSIPSFDEEGRLFAGVNSYSQYNLAYHILIEGATRVASAQPRPSETAGAAVPAQAAGDAARIETVRLSAASLEQLAERAAGMARNAEEFLRRAASLRFEPTDRFRLAIVARNAEELAAAGQLASNQLHRPEARTLLAEKGVYVGEPASGRSQVLFAFPGQGSQYTGMLKQLVQEYAPAAEALRDVERVFAALQLPRFEDLAFQDGDVACGDVWRTQLSLLAADTIMYAAVRAMGIKPDRLTGHSFGELAALVAAGAWSFEDALRATCARCAAIDSCSGSNGVMLSTSAPVTVVESLCSQVGGRIFVSHRNAPDQTVVGGDEQPVSELARRLAADGYQTRALDVPAAFHTPLMEPVKAPFAEGIANVPLEPPSIPLISSVTNRYVADPQDIRDNLIVQLTRPVNYADLVERVYGEGFRVIVEVGPKQVLTGLHRRVLGQRPAALISCDHKKRTGVEQLVHVRACVEANTLLESAADRPAVCISATPAAEKPTPATSKPAEQGGVGSKTVPPAGVEQIDGLTILRLSGTPYEMGVQHGKSMAVEIKVALRRHADLAGTKWDTLTDFTAAAAHPEHYFGEQELEELRGIAAGAGVTMSSVVAHNLRLFLDAGSGGIHFAVTAQANPAEGLVHAANEELQRGLCLRDCLARSVQVRRPSEGISHVTFAVAGQLGGLNGINASGVAVSSAALLDVPRADAAATGKLQTILVKKILEGARDIESALEIIRASREGTVAWSICLSHHADDRLCYVEFDGKELKVQHAPPTVIAANHRLMRTFPGEAPAHSRQRLERLKTLLGGDPPQRVSVTQAQEALRDRFDQLRHRESPHPTKSTIRRVDNQISIVMQPGAGKLWITHGPLANGHQNRFSMLNLQELLPLEPASPLESRTAPAAGPQSAISANELAAAYAGEGTNGSGAPGQPVCGRFVMRVVEQPRAEPSGDSSMWQGAALVLGENADAGALFQLLQQQGVPVSQLPATEDIDAACMLLDQIWETQPILHLFVMTPRDEAATALDEGSWIDRRTRGVILPYLFIQRWYQRVAEAGRLNDASIVAATAMGGDFGFSSQVRAVDGGALAGLIKGIHLELKIGNRDNTFRAKVIDADAGMAPAQLAENILADLAANDEESEIGYIGGQRYVVRPVPQPIPHGTETAPLTGGPIVITGGARGVTAVVARELGLRLGLPLHLIGSSPIPEIPETYHQLSADELKELRSTVMKDALASGAKPIDTWARFEKAMEIDRTMRSLAAAGVRATYHACDVGNRAALSQVLDAIRRQDGPIQAVVHGAGFERASRFEKKQADLVDRTVRAKVDGAAALMELTWQDPLRAFIAFGSVSGRFGGVGQTDYCLANEMLAKLVDWYRRERTDCPATIFHWHAWDDVGMAVRPESQHIRKLHNIRFMPSQEGAAHLVDELQAGLPEAEIVITELGYCTERYAGAQPTAAPALIKPAGPAAAFGVEMFPLIDAAGSLEPGKELSAAIHLDPVNDVFLRQHRFKGRPMMPVVATMEALAEAAQLLAGRDRKVVGLRNLEILNGLRFHADVMHTGRLHAVAQADHVTCDFTCDFHNRRGQMLQKDKPYLRGIVDVADRQPQLALAPPRMPESWTNCWYPEEDIVIYHGPIFRCLHQIAVEGDEAWGRLVAPPLAELGGDRRGDGWVIPPAILDSCFFACGIFLWFRFTGVVAIPFGIDRLCLGRQTRPGEHCVVHLKFLGKEKEQGTFNFAVFGDDGSPILMLEGYRNVIVSEEPAHAV